MDGGLGWPEVSQADANNPTEWIPRNFLQPHRGQSTGGIETQTRVAFFRGLAPQFVDYLLTRLAWTCCIRCADRVVAFAVRKEALPHGSLGFCFDLGTGFLALEVFRVNDYALFIVGRMFVDRKSVV